MHRPRLRSYIAYFFMTLTTQSLPILAKNTLCILELKVVSFTGFMKYDYLHKLEIIDSVQ